MKSKSRIILVIFIIAQLVLYIPATYAQDGYIQNEGTSLWKKDENFIDELDKADSVTGEMEKQMDSDFETGGGQYLNEDDLLKTDEGQIVSQNQVTAAALDESKRMLDQNIYYGLATGGMIGGWMALINSNDGRGNARWIGSGIVLGGLLGFMIGTKAVYQNPAQAKHIKPEEHNFDIALVPQENEKIEPRLKYTFRF